MSKLLITGSLDDHMWYAGLVGKEVELIRECDEYYISREPGGCTNRVLKTDAKIVRPIKYSTEELYGTSTLNVLKGEVHYIEIRLDLLQSNLERENAKHWRIRDSHLITKIIDAQNFWRARIKEIEC